MLELRGRRLGESSSRRTFDSKYCNCFQACFQARTCEQCGTFNDEKHIAWCTICEKRVARWCPACCTPNEIVTPICNLCSRSSSSGFCWIVWQAVLDRKVTRDDLIRHTAVVANPVVGIAHAPAAGNSMMRSSLLGVPVVLCELLVGAPCASLQSALSCCCALLAMTEAQRGELMSSSFVGSARLVKMRCYDSDCLNG